MEEHPDGFNRILVNQLNSTTGPIIIINMYMPKDSTQDADTDYHQGAWDY